MTAVALEPCLMRECNCPDFVVSCVHWGDALLTLHHCQVNSEVLGTSKCYWVHSHWRDADADHYNSLSDAEAEFERRATLLRSEA